MGEIRRLRKSKPLKSGKFFIKGFLFLLLVNTKKTSVYYTWMLNNRYLIINFRAWPITFYAKESLT